MTGATKVPLAVKDLRQSGFWSTWPAPGLDDTRLKLGSELINLSTSTIRLILIGGRIQ